MYIAEANTYEPDGKGLLLLSAEKLLNDVLSSNFFGNPCRPLLNRSVTQYGNMQLL